MIVICLYNKVLLVYSTGFTVKENTHFGSLNKQGNLITEHDNYLLHFSVLTILFLYKVV